MFTHPIASILSLCMLAGMAAPMTGFSQETATTQVTLPVKRVITAADGRTISGAVTAFGGGMITFRRTDGKTFDIQLADLSQADQTEIGNWVARPSYRPSSVSIAGNSSLQRSSYPSPYQPRYSSGRVAGYRNTGSGNSSSTRKGECRLVRVVTVTKGGCCPNKSP